MSLLLASVKVSIDWFSPLSEPVRPKQLIGSFASASGSAALSHAWYQPYSEPSVKYRRRAAQYQDLAWSTFTPAAENITEDKWHYPWSEPVRLKPGLPARLQQFFTAPIPQIGEDSWHYPWSEPVRKKPGLAAGLQQFFTTDPFPRPNEVVTEDKWHYPWADPVRVKPGLKTGLQQFFTTDPFPRPNFQVNEDDWHQPWSEPIRVKPRLSTESQQFFAYGSFQPIVSFSYFSGLSEPKRIKPTVVWQQFFAFYSQPFVSFGWSQALSEPSVKEKSGLKPQYQQSIAFYPFPFGGEVVTIDKWYQSYSQPVRTRPFNVALQRGSVDSNFTPATVPNNARLDATETKDTFFGFAQAYNTAERAIVGIHEDARTGIVGVRSP